MNLKSAILAIMAVGQMWGQNTIVLSGKVTDAVTGLPVENTAIALTQNGHAATRSVHYTDSGGNYSFDEVAPGAGTVEIQATGFLAFQKTNPDDVLFEW
jgi:protocatechuate 3,4-dioxygenase beta subunit